MQDPSKRVRLPIAGQLGVSGAVPIEDAGTSTVSGVGCNMVGRAGIGPLCCAHDESDSDKTTRKLRRPGKVVIYCFLIQLRQLLLCHQGCIKHIGMRSTD
jgi:hypothetical protein